MVVASFLCKDLGISWRHGERYFAEQLNDFDLSANNGGWQWAASSGCDAQPYFRIFNPVTQSEKFDPEGKFIRRYVFVFPALCRCQTNIADGIASRRVAGFGICAQIADEIDTLCAELIEALVQLQDAHRQLLLELLEPR